MSIPKEIKIPVFIQASIFFVGIVALIAILYVAQGIIVPLVFAFIIAIVLHPVVNFITRFKIHRVLAIVITILLTFIVIAGIGVLILSQASRFSESFPILVERSTDLFNLSITKASAYLNITPEVIHEWITKTKNEIINSGSSAIGQTLVTLGNGLVVLFLIPIYVLIILYYHPLLIEFVHRLFSKSNQTKVSEIISQIKTVIQRYLVGLVIEAGIVATLNSVGLLLLGIQYAILLGIIGAVLNLIPYIGGMVAVALPIMVALATKTTVWPAIYVLLLYTFVQLFDNNYIVPKIVASKVKINALFSIIVVIVGNALWGISGMFLSIPILAIIKLIFDRIESTKPWGFLLGDTMPSLFKVKLILKKKTIG